MRHDYRLDGEAFRLRPAGVEDAALIVSLRTDPERGRYLNATSSSVVDQVAWTERYFQRPGDFYFVVERIGDAAAEGVISLYDEADGAAEWGRWILRPGSLAAPESALLIYRFGFQVRGLRKLYCRTVAANEKVVQFHTSSGLRTEKLLIGYFNGEDSVEQVADVELWPEIERRLSRAATMSARLAARRTA